jgi:hypothetical protein
MSDEVKTTSPDEELAKKRAEAAKAMSFGLGKPPITLTADAEVKADTVPVPPTIEQVAEKKLQPEDSIKLAQKRLQAQIAMEGEERRKARQEIERQEREAAEKKRQAEELVRKQAFEKEKMEKERLEQEVRLAEQRQRVSQELKQQVEEVKEGGAGGLKTIRTLKNDQDTLIKGQNLSLIGIAIKEEERRRQQQENTSISSSSNRPFLVASIILLILGSGIGFYIYNQYYAEVPVGILPGKSTVLESILFAEANKAIDVSGITTEDLLSRIKNEVRNPPDLRLGAVENYVFNKKNEAGLTLPLSAYDFFKLIVSSAPENFLRSLEQKFMFGILSSAENAAFIIVKTESYDKGLAGLLEWEGKTLTKDLYQILTSLKPDIELFTKKYEDLLIKNIDTRVLKDKNGDIRIIYGFLDQTKTIVIAGSRQAFTEAVNRFNTPKPLSQ